MQRLHNITTTLKASSNHMLTTLAILCCVSVSVILAKGKLCAGSGGRYIASTGLAIPELNLSLLSLRLNWLSQHLD